MVYHEHSHQLSSPGGCGKTSILRTFSRRLTKTTEFPIREGQSADCNIRVFPFSLRVPIRGKFQRCMLFEALLREKRFFLGLNWGNEKRGRFAPEDEFVVTRSSLSRDCFRHVEHLYNH